MMYIKVSIVVFHMMYYIVSTMNNDVTKGIKPLRLKALPAEMRRALIQAREKHGWSQRDLASRLGVGQRHISGIESGKIVPRYDTLLEIVRMLDRDLIMVPVSYTHLRAHETGRNLVCRL